MPAPNTTWNDLINNVPVELVQTSDNTDADDTTLLQIVNTQYVELCHETRAFFNLETQVKSTEIENLVKLDFTTVGNFNDTDMTHVDKIIGHMIDGNHLPSYKLDGGTVYSLVPARDREQMTELVSGDTTHFVVIWPYLYIAPPGAASALLKIPLFFQGAECAAVDAADAGPAFHESVQILGEKTLKLRIAAAFAGKYMEDNAQALMKEAAEATATLKQRVNELIG